MNTYLPPDQHGEAVSQIGAVLVAGGGIAGMQAALDLADSGFFVYLLEQSENFGSHMMPGGSRQEDPELSRVAAAIRQCRHHLNIRCMSLCKVVDIEGSAGAFTVLVKESPGYVDAGICIGCGLCVDACPQDRQKRLRKTETVQKAIFTETPSTCFSRYFVDVQSCLQFRPGGRTCTLCTEACPVQAIRFGDQERIHRLPVGAVILDSGISAFDPSRMESWQYGRQENVVTSWEFAQYLSEIPKAGRLVRLSSDHNSVKKVAFVQCIGSRDEHHSDHVTCSSTCCTQAARLALKVRRLYDDVEATIFYTDLRASHKEGDFVFGQAVTAGVRLVRCRTGGLETSYKKLVIRSTSSAGRQVEEDFDMVVLSVGSILPHYAFHLAKVANIHLKANKFAVSSDFTPVQSSREGIFVCGGFTGPKEVEQLLVEGSAVAAAVGGLLAEVRHSLSVTDFYPPTRDVSREEPRVGVFFCQCGGRITAEVELSKLLSFASRLESVVFTDDPVLACTVESRDRIGTQIQEQRLNRILLIGCSAESHLSVFQEMVRRVGLHASLVDLYDIRATSGDAAGLTRHKEELRRMVKNLADRLPQHEQKTDIHPTALVVGGGMAGMSAALNLAQQGFPVDLVESEARLGGNARSLQYTWSGEYVPSQLQQMIDHVSAHPRIRLHLGCDLLRCEGHSGAFRTTLRGTAGQLVSLDHGAAVLATGAVGRRPDEFGYNQMRCVISSTEFDKLYELRERRIRLADSVAFIQCAGSRNEKVPYCSKVCCTHSVQVAMALKKEEPKRRIYILYRDMRTYGWREFLYRRARKMGILFIRYSHQKKPVLRETSGKIEIEAYDEILRQRVIFEVDLAVLANGIATRDNARNIGMIFGVKQDSDGFYSDVAAGENGAHGPAVQVAGMARAPMPLEDSVVDALASAAKVAVLLSRK